MIKLLHLSHIDLDGYGCQYLTSKYFKNINCYNANYGPEVTSRIKEIIYDIKKSQLFYPNQEIMILITDLNLTPKESAWIEKEAKELDVGLQLLDHHATGQTSADRYKWYHLDSSKSATLITYNWLQNLYKFDEENTLLDVVKTINAIDIWLSDDKFFELGKVCLGMIAGSREINKIVFPDNDRAFKLFLIDSIQSVISEKDSNILLDDNLHSIKKEFFTDDKNDTKDNLVASYITDLLGKDKDRFKIFYKNYKGVLGYNIGSSSIIGNRFLLDNPDYDFYMDISSRGSFSLRSNDKLDVSIMAQEIGNGGGHPNASGGKIEGFKNSFVYEKVKLAIVEHIKTKTIK